MLSEDARIAVLDRGLGAIRFIDAVREVNSQRGTRLRTIAFRSGGRAEASTREADEAVEAGGGLVEALRDARVEAVWIGPRADGNGLIADQAGRALGLEFVDGPLRPVQGRVPVSERRIDVPVLRDATGVVWAVGIVDRSRGLASSPSQHLAPWDEAAILGAARSAVVELRDVRLATVSFGFDPETSAATVRSIAPGTATGHEVVEARTGIDLVKSAVEIALGDKLNGASPTAHGYAVGAYLNATGDDDVPVVEHLRFADGPGLRVDVAAHVGDVFTGRTVAALVAHGRDRGEAVSRLRRALLDTAVVIGAETTDRSRSLSALEDARAEITASEDVQRIAVLQAAIDAYGAAVAADAVAFYASAGRGRPRVPEEMGKGFEMRAGDALYRLAVYQTGPRTFRIMAPSEIAVEVDRVSRYESVLRVAGGTYRILSVVSGRDHRVEVEGHLHRVAREDTGVVAATVPAVLVSYQVPRGARVRRGQTVAVLEAMKMEMAIASPIDGIVRAHLAIPNTHVPAGTPLLRIDPEAETGALSEGDLSGFASGDGAFGRDAQRRALAALEGMRALLLGYESNPGAVDRLTEQWSQALSEMRSVPAPVRSAEDGIVGLFADICALSRGQPVAEDEASEQMRSAQEDLYAYLRTLDATTRSLSGTFRRSLARALVHHGVHDLTRSPELERAVFMLNRCLHRLSAHSAFVTAILSERLEQKVPGEVGEGLRETLDRLIWAAQRRFPSVTDTAREVRYRCFDQPLFDETWERVYSEVETKLGYLAQQPTARDRDSVVRWLVDCPQPLKKRLTGLAATAGEAVRSVMLEVLVRRYYRIRDLTDVAAEAAGGVPTITARYTFDNRRIRIVAAFTRIEDLDATLAAIGTVLARIPPTDDAVVDVFVSADRPEDDPEAAASRYAVALDAARWTRPARRVAIGASTAGAVSAVGRIDHFTFRPSDGGYVEERLYRGFHPMMGKRLGVWRLKRFFVDRLPSVEDVYLFRAVARDNPRDERLVAFAEVRDLTEVRDANGRLIGLPYLERMLAESLEAIRVSQGRRPPAKRLYWNRVLLYVWPPLELSFEELFDVVYRLAPATEGLGLEKVEVRVGVREPDTGAIRTRVLDISNPAGRGLALSFDEPSDDPIEPLSTYEQKVVKMRQRGLTYPYEIVKMLAPTSEILGGAIPPGTFVEHDLDAGGRLVPVERPPGENSANIVAGVVTNRTETYPEGMARVVLLGDPSQALGSLAEPECRRIIAGLDLAEEMGVPLEWFAVSAGAKISMESGTENMDWIAAVLRRLIEFTQRGGEVNVIVCGINVGAQPYWNAEATMLMHTSGILVMTADAAMVLTGKQALDFSGGVSADDNFGIGGYDRVMGPNGQAQYWARDIGDACETLLRHYEHTYVVPGERFPRRAPTSDPVDRDVRSFEHRSDEESDFATVGEVFSDSSNPGRKKAFDIRSVMRSVSDLDHRPLERWAGWRDAEIAVVWDAHVGGYPVCLLGIESKPLPRRGPVPADGPEQWTSGTLFPMASKKIARAVNAASGNRPLVVLANLSGFDGSPESMRSLQLEHGAEIGRAVVNFDGPMVFCVVSRYHGGAFVVFSAALNESMEVAAVEGSYASVIGGAPAAAAVFARAVETRTKEDPRVVELTRRMEASEGRERARLRAELARLSASVRSEKLGEAAREFDNVHTIQRAQRVGSVHTIISPENLRPYVIDAVARGIAGSG